MADKEPAGSQDEPTPADDLVDSEAIRDEDEEIDPAEPTGEELLAESDTSGARGISDVTRTVTGSRSQ